MEVRAAVLSIGDELTLGQISERNSRRVSEEFLAVGLIVDEHRCVADDRHAIAAAMNALVKGHRILVVTGGLGPTADDLTREALCDAMGGAILVEDLKARQQIEARFKGRSGGMPKINLKQALVPAGAMWIENPNGTAPGLAASIGGSRVYCLPGPPNEMVPMLVANVMPEVKELLFGTQAEACACCTIHSCGLSESVAATRIEPFMQRSANPMVGTTASGAVVSARIRASGKAVSDGSLQRVIAAIENNWHPYVFGRDAMTIEQSIGRELVARGAMLALAESCTGGLLGATCTDAAGSSQWLKGGWIVYTNELKVHELGVDAAVLARDGAVSRSTACAMAIGAATKADCRFGLSTTGIAGPSGGTEEKPVGTVWIGIADRCATVSEHQVMARQFRFSGDRQSIRQRAVRIALQLLRFSILGQRDVPMLWEVTQTAGAR